MNLFFINRLQRSLFKMALLIVLLMLCVSNETEAQTTVFDSITIDGLTREYRLYIPEIYDPTQEVPLVLNLHGYGSNSLEQLLYGNFISIADTANFIIAVPNGTPDLTGTLSWNTFGLSQIDEISFFRQFIDSLSEDYSIDQDRIYATGMSNGGFMSYDLACGLNDRITAVASVTGSMNVLTINSCNPNRTVPVMQIHGTADATVPYIGNLAFAPIDSVVSFWRGNNVCTEDPIFEELPDIDVSDNCTAEHYVWNCSLTNSSVELYKVIGGGHSWPGALVNINTTNQDFSASAEIWRFFSQYRKSDFPLTVDITEEIEKFKLFPNPSQRVFNVNFERDEERLLQIIDYSGKEVYSEKSNSKNLQIALDQRGIYIIKVITTNNISFKKLIIQ